MSAPSPAATKRGEANGEPIGRFRVLGVRVDAVQIADVIEILESWIASREQSRFVAVTGMHGVMEAQHDAAFRSVLGEAALVVPDGMPLVWLGRRCGYPLARRVYGPELMETFCRETASKGYRHFFYGGGPGVADQLARTLAERCPGLVVAGSISPPYRILTEDEDKQMVGHINSARPDVVWVGLSTPKQERWMWEHRAKFNAPVMLGVGAAFDFLIGRIPRAPRWMRENGFEWLYRLVSEPRRLWRRYLVYGTEFVWLVGLEQMGWRKFEPANGANSGIEA